MRVVLHRVLTEQLHGRNVQDTGTKSAVPRNVLNNASPCSISSVVNGFFRNEKDRSALDHHMVWEGLISSSN